MTTNIHDYDVVVVGAGGGGMTAAIAASDEGANVLLVESDRTVGGSTALSGGVVYAAGTTVQRAAGILYDSAEAMYAYYMTVNQWKVDPAVAWRYCQETAPTLEWLISLGVKFPPTHLHATGIDGVPRSHEAIGEGAGLVHALEQAVRARNVDMAFGQRVRGLLRDAGGRIAGIRTETDELTAGAVVMATGGFGHNRELLESYYPDAAAAGDLCWSVSTPHAIGDGLLIGLELGASIAGFNRGLLLATTTMDKVFETPLPTWLMLVNESGQRFVDESAPHTVMTGVIRAQRGPVYAVFDEQARIHGGPHPENLRCQRSSNFTADAIRLGVENGQVVRASTLDELGERLAMPPGALRSAGDRSNRWATTGHDDEFFKQEAFLRQIDDAPFYAVEVKPAIISFTGAGLKIDPEARVLDQTGTAFDGLFAAGEVAGSVHGKRYLGGGNGLGNCLNFGRIAGKNAATHSLHKAQA